MKPISLPWHLMMPTLFCLLGLILIGVRCRRLLSKSKRKWIWRGIFISLLAYILVVGKATSDDIVYQVELNRFDLNGDGRFDTSERSPQQKDAIHRLTNDAGRNYSVFTGAILGLTLGLLTFGIGKLSELVIKRNN